MYFDVVIPVKDENRSIELLIENIISVLNSLKMINFCKIIIIDDGSTDGTWEKIIKSYEKYPEIIKGIQLRRNFGKAVALEVGFSESNSDILITMDGDLQDDPKEIPRFLTALDQGYDLISGWKKSRKDPATKRWPSLLFNRVTSFATGVKLHDFNCGFKAYRKEVIESLRLYGELHRYIPVLAHDAGFRVGEIEVTHHPRRHGKSKYGIERYARGLLDLITVLATTRWLHKPAHLFGGIGLGTGFLGFVILGYLSTLWLIDKGPIGNRPLFFLGILLCILSVQLISLGVIAELLIRVGRSKSPEHIIKKRL